MSDFSISWLLEGKDRIKHSEVTPGAWLHLLNTIYTSHVVVNELGHLLFSKIGEFMNEGERNVWIQVQVPPRLTKFSEGIGVNTKVRFAPLRHDDSVPKKVGESVTRKRSFLLLLKQEKTDGMLAWARWDLEHVILKKHSTYDRTVTKSQIRLLNEDEVLDIFAKYPNAPFYLMHIYAKVTNEAERLMRSAMNVARFSEFLYGVEGRVSTS